MKRPRSESMPLERSQGQTQRESKGPVLRVHCSSACPQAQPISLVSLVLRDSDSPRLTWISLHTLHPVQSSVRALFSLHCSTVLVSLHSHFSSRHLWSNETSMILARWVPRTRSKSEAPRSEYLLKERRKIWVKKGFFF